MNEKYKKTSGYGLIFRILFDILPIPLWSHGGEGSSASSSDSSDSSDSSASGSDSAPSALSGVSEAKAVALPPDGEL